MTKAEAQAIKDELIQTWKIAEYADGRGWDCETLEDLKEHYLDDEDLEILEILDREINGD